MASETLVRDCGRFVVEDNVDVAVDKDGRLVFSPGVAVDVYSRGSVLTLCPGSEPHSGGDNNNNPVTFPALSPVVYRLDASCRFGSIELSGPSSLSGLPAEYLNEREVSIDVRGPGSVRLGQSADLVGMLSVSVDGAGAVHSDGLVAEVAHLWVAGAGSVSGFVIATRGHVEVNGAGRVDVCASDPKHVDTYVAGAGAIAVRKASGVRNLVGI